MKTQAEQRAPKFNIHEIVQVFAQPPRIHQDLRQKEGIIVGWSDPGPDSCRDYGVHINEYGETFSIPEDSLRSIGHFANRHAIASRSRAKGRKRAQRRVTHNGQDYEVVAEELPNGKYVVRIDFSDAIGRYIRQPDIQQPDPKTGETVTKQGPPVEFDTEEVGLNAGVDNVRLGMI